MVQIDIDYAVVTVGSSTPMQGSTIIVDDLNEEITWNGQWAERRGIAYVTGLDDGRPFGNGTKESSNIGDSMEFTFAGTSIALYGVFSWKASGFITAKFTITDFPSNFTSYSEEKSFFSPSNAPDLLNSTNFLFFDHDSLTATNHTLTVMITGVSGNQSLILDYLTYQPSFGSLSAKPDFRSSSSSGLGAGSGSVPPNVGNDSSSAGEHSSHAGAIAGGVVGGVAAVALIVAFLFWRYRRSTPKQIKQVEFGDNLIGDDIDNEPSRYFDSVIHHSPDGATILPPLLPTTTRHDSSRSFKRSDSPYTSATGSTSLPYGASFSKLATPNDMLLDQRNAELKALNGQITEMQERMVAHSSDPVISSPTQTALTDQIKLLQERIEALMRENETLGGYDNSGPPTVYMYEAFGESTVVPGSSVGERSPVT
ncbi:hypothetical protein D9758_013882 [Tetrapyrgos nigripes]|uniref:Uncharacterized protein n=1 Tax=Tetrapyrgos nigripes TaxID=182062 RepID=A0A8H5CQH0_9AGAR|nr:hypothetical protein D9758_013882 [Tetrapyrgos nigripes]